MSIDRLASALARLEDFIGDVCDEDLDQLDAWLDEAVDEVSRERKRRADTPGGSGGAEDA